MKLSMPDFSAARMLVAGDLMLDRYWHGDTSRISPEAPVPVITVQNEEERPGGAGNVAVNLASLGARVRVLGCVAGDAAGASLLASLRAIGVDCTRVQQREAPPTIIKLRALSRNQQVLRMDFEQPATVPTLDGAADEKLLDGITAVIISDYDKGTIGDPQALIQQARALDIPVFVDSKRKDFHAYRDATLLTPNLREFEAVAGDCGGDEELLAQRGLQLAEQLRLEALLITRGEKGLTLLRPGYPELHLPARAREVYDVTGAGDTVVAVLAAALAAVIQDVPPGERAEGLRKALPHSVALANLAAGIAVGQQGAVGVTAPELQREAFGERDFERGVLDNREQARLAVENARRRGERVVFSNGCFDILHNGHVHTLQQAAALGDRLLVAVNDDRSVGRLKGEGRPVNTLERRMAVLAALEVVDWVVPFHEDTPEELLQVLKPDVLVKGGDYRLEEVTGREFVQSYGGEVRLVELLPDSSTTGILQKIGRE